MNIKTGQVVTFKPEYQDAGDDKLTFRAINDMEKGRVDVMVDEQAHMYPQPIYTVSDYMIDR